MEKKKERTRRVFPLRQVKFPFFSYKKRLSEIKSEESQTPVTKSRVR